MALDMDRQPVDLPAVRLSATTIAAAATRREIAFAGSGDSYVAAMAACYLSQGRAHAHRPPDIAADPAVARGRDLYFVSVSGATRANVLAATAARRAGLRTAAVTADASSQLAKACDDVIRLEFRSAGVKTSGTIGFTACLLACAALAGHGQEIAGAASDIASIYNAAKKEVSKKPIGKGRSTMIVLGDSLLYPAAAYGALKFNEVLGARAFAYPLEEFFHAPLFGLQKGDMVIIVGPDGNPARRLEKEGFASLHIGCGDPSQNGGINTLLYAAFVMQHLALGAARERGLEECYFVKNKKLLKASSDFIY